MAKGESTIDWVLTLLGIKKRLLVTIGDIVESDLAVAGAVARAYSLHDAEQYARMLEQRGETALAAEIRRQVAMLTQQAVQPTFGTVVTATPAGPPLAAAPSAQALPPAGPAKRKPGRPPKNPPTGLPEGPTT